MALQITILLTCYLLLIEFGSAVSAVNCVHRTIDVGGRAIIVYSKLDQIKPVGTVNFLATDLYDETVTYEFRICEDIVQNACGTQGATPVCQRDNSAATAYSLGQLSTQAILDYPTSDKSLGVMFEYSNGTYCSATGQGRSVYITIECDPLATAPLFNIVASNSLSNGCDFQIYARSPYACPDTADYVCAAQTTCASCKSVNGCGWCAASQRCAAGNPGGPRDGTQCVGASSWFFGDQSPCIDCQSINSCSSCSLNGDCVYCGEGCRQRQGSTCSSLSCKCDPCQAGEYCPPSGGHCLALPNAGGLFVGGMFLGFGMIGLAAGVWYLYKRNKEKSFPSVENKYENF